MFCIVVFFFQAEDGIRDWSVTGVQTVLFRSVALQRISLSMKGVRPTPGSSEAPRQEVTARETTGPTRRRRRKIAPAPKIGRASCRERVESSGGGGALRKKEGNGGVIEGVKEE